MSPSAATKTLDQPGHQECDYMPWPWSRRCPVVRAELRRMWFQLRQQGIYLPAERGLILIDGGTT